MPLTRGPWRHECVEAGLVDGSKLFADASLIDTDASNNSVVDTHSLKKYLKKGYRQLEKRLDEFAATKTTPANSRHISRTDPDASVTRHSSGKSKLRYKTHRGVDERHEVITATTVTAGSVDYGEVLEEIIDQHERNTTRKVGTIVADSKYGKIDNYLLCHDLNIRAHIPSLEATHRGSGRQKGIFPKEAFTYHPDTDIFTCPGGKILKRRHHYTKRNHYEHKAAAQACAGCELKEHCTRSKQGRTLKRHLRQDELDHMLHIAKTSKAKRDIKTRQHLSEPSFARLQRYGFKRARWRRAWRVQIQDFLIAAIQNIMVLVTQPQERVSKSNAQRGHSIRAQRATWAQFSFGSFLRAVFNQFSMAGGLA